MGEDGEEGIRGRALANGDAVDLIEFLFPHEMAVFLSEHVILLVVANFED